MDIKLLYLLLLNLIIFFLVKFSKRTKWLNNALLLLFTTVFLLTIIELAYRFFFKKSTIVEKGNFGGSLNIPNSTYGFIMKPIDRVHHFKIDKETGDSIYNVTYSIIPDSGFNRQNINHRVGYFNNQSSNDSVELVFLGCSFTFGSGINDTATLPYYAGRYTGYNTLNMASGGWGTHQVYQLFTRKYKRTPDKKKRVFVYSFLPDHLLRAKCIYSWNINDPYFTVQHDSLYLAGPAYKHSRYARFQGIIRFISVGRIFSFISDKMGNIGDKNAAKGVNDEDYKRIELMLNEIASDAESRGDQLVIVHWNDYKGVVSAQKIGNILNQLQGKGAAVLNITDVLNINDSNNFIPKDNHPTGIANSRIATALLKFLRTRNHQPGTSWAKSN